MIRTYVYEYATCHKLSFHTTVKTRTPDRTSTQNRGRACFPVFLSRIKRFSHNEHTYTQKFFNKKNSIKESLVRQT